MAEAENFGASRGHVRYDVDKGFARAELMLVCYALAPLCRAPLLEAFCSEQSRLGTVGESIGREVLRFTEAEDMADEQHVRVALQALRERSGAHVHGSLPCTP